MNNNNSLKDVAGRLAFDIDGVFANTMELFIRLIREYYQIDSIRYEDITQYFLYDCLPLDREKIDVVINKILDYPHALEMDPFDHSVPVLTRYAENHPLVFITARNKEAPIRDWVLQTLPEVDPKNIRVIATGEHHLKLDLLKDLGFSYYLDDHLDTCIQLAQNGIKPIVFSQPWNTGNNDFHRVDDWVEVEKILLPEGV
ncbi:MAG TPA: haloacid dehalogenase [Thermodesulfobacteriota bacterium]|nr:haloacid dehalogenase [Thermodesulfobacteriota bacterium]